MHQDEQLKAAKALKQDGGLSEIKFHALDITDGKSLETFVEDLKKTHANGIDFVINNAGIALNGFDSNVVSQTLNCNYYSTLAASHAFLPLLRPAGRLVNVASTTGLLDKYSPAIRARFLASKTEADVTSIMQDFASAVAAGREKEAGFPSAAYATSKAGLIGATRALAREESGKSQVLVNSCCPGYVNTDMTKGRGTRTPDEGAQTPVMLALADLKGVSGEFWRDGRVIDWSG
ncbi:NAD(P)-binding protein [Westerdykella ornata]|uniref:NAD(P)-binding protein n=1 Tax=Westerdykella ornata TaxID=318751 RepID=A0A6A6J8V0_WESOR|nr:NAD(P)-binding protein [Westerdykella ornata]KAF2272852.1 NAD(P)-binding protein [Westerdykella ornata]